MDKNCLNCVYREVVYDCQTEVGVGKKPMIRTGNPYSRCAIDRELRVNGRMRCEKWSNRVTIDIGRAPMPRHVQELIKM